MLQRGIYIYIYINHLIFINSVTVKSYNDRMPSTVVEQDPSQPKPDNRSRSSRREGGYDTKTSSLLFSDLNVIAPFKINLEEMSQL